MLKVFNSKIIELKTLLLELTLGRGSLLQIDEELNNPVSDYTKCYS
ncbi:MAG: hypothetical protein JWR38_2281 [Mucilaginibacter sp.]|nr:hypothetical protein [Mucilaginibacter sp.]